MKSMFSKRHYEAIAEVLRNAWSRETDIGRCVVEDVGHDLGALFEADNEQFNRTKWEEACER